MKFSGFGRVFYDLAACDEVGSVGHDQIEYPKTRFGGLGGGGGGGRTSFLTSGRTLSFFNFSICSVSCLISSIS